MTALFDDTVSQTTPTAGFFKLQSVTAPSTVSLVVFPGRIERRFSGLSPRITQYAHYLVLFFKVLSEAGKKDRDNHL